MLPANAELLLGLQGQIFGAGVKVNLAAPLDCRESGLMNGKRCARAQLGGEHWPAGLRHWVLSPVPINTRQPSDAAGLLCTFTSAHCRVCRL